MQATAPHQNKKEKKKPTELLHYNYQVINTWIFIMVRKLPYLEDFQAKGRHPNFYSNITFPGPKVLKHCTKDQGQEQHYLLTPKAVFQCASSQLNQLNLSK